MYRCAQKGISLLETLLALVIVTSILILAVRYYDVAHRQMLVNQAVSQINKITQASYEWLQTQRQENFDGNSGGTTIEMSTLINAGLLENNTAYTIDPWGGNILVGPSTDASTVAITLPDMPLLACSNLRDTLSNSAKVIPTCAPNNENNSFTFTGEF